MNSPADSRTMTPMTPAAKPMPRAADVDNWIGCAELEGHSDDVVGVDADDVWVDVDMAGSVPKRI